MNKLLENSSKRFSARIRLPSPFPQMGKERSAGLKFICSDIWKPYPKAIAKKAGQSIHVLDRYHIMAKMNKTIDEVRAAEAKQLKQKGQRPILKRRGGAC